MSFQEAALFIGILLGSLSSSYIYRWTSATTLFAISATFAMIAVLYIVFSVEESVQNTPLSDGKMVWQSDEYSSPLNHTITYFRNSSVHYLMLHLWQTYSRHASSNAPTWTEL